MNKLREPHDAQATGLRCEPLEDKARDLKARNVQQLGELVISTGADALSANELAGALMSPDEGRGSVLHG